MQSYNSIFVRIHCFPRLIFVGLPDPPQLTGSVAFLAVLRPSPQTQYFISPHAGIGECQNPVETDSSNPGGRSQDWPAHD